ncbi:hypothetical protein BB561_000761 [Smittium simulii]|uniref:Protein kinase domain-containing protein n=1 Tax=Smittium simulii TaxID=133385 RepID=A0A2T9YXP8_9FUNG|nr:hypothetical protein BB561_000761 [Smittium simulii]
MESISLSKVDTGDDSERKRITPATLSFRKMSEADRKLIKNSFGNRAKKKFVWKNIQDSEVEQKYLSISPPTTDRHLPNTNSAEYSVSSQNPTNTKKYSARTTSGSFSSYASSRGSYKNTSPTADSFSKNFPIELAKNNLKAFKFSKKHSSSHLDHFNQDVEIVLHFGHLVKTSTGTFAIIKFISKESKSNSYLAEQLTTKKKALLKHFFNDELLDINIILNQIFYMKFLNNQIGFINFLGEKHSSNQIFIFSEFFSDQDLTSFLFTYKDIYIDEHLILTIFNQICESVSFLHSLELPLAHFNLLPSSILINEKVARIANFDYISECNQKGIAKNSSYLRHNLLQNIPTHLLPPEIILDDQSDYIGVHCGNESDLSSVVEAKYTIPKTSPYSSEIVDLFETMLCVNPYERVSSLSLYRRIDRFIKKNFKRNFNYEALYSKDKEIIDQPESKLPSTVSKSLKSINADFDSYHHGSNANRPFFKDTEMDQNMSKDFESNINDENYDKINDLFLKNNLEDAVFGSIRRSITSRKNPNNNINRSKILSETQNLETTSYNNLSQVSHSTSSHMNLDFIDSTVSTTTASNQYDHIDNLHQPFKLNNHTSSSPNYPALNSYSNIMEHPNSTNQIFENDQNLAPKLKTSNSALTSKFEHDKKHQGRVKKIAQTFELPSSYIDLNSSNHSIKGISHFRSNSTLKDQQYLSKATNQTKKIDSIDRESSNQLFIKPEKKNSLAKVENNVQNNSQATSNFKTTDNQILDSNTSTNVKSSSNLSNSNLPSKKIYFNEELDDLQSEILAISIANKKILSNSATTSEYNIDSKYTNLERSADLSLKKSDIHSNQNNYDIPDIPDIEDQNLFNFTSDQDLEKSKNNEPDSLIKTEIDKGDSKQSIPRQEILQESSNIYSTLISSRIVSEDKSIEKVVDPQIKVTNSLNSNHNVNTSQFNELKYDYNEKNSDSYSTVKSENFSDNLTENNLSLEDNMTKNFTDKLKITNSRNGIISSKITKANPLKSSDNYSTKNAFDNKNYNYSNEENNMVFDVLNSNILESQHDNNLEYNSNINKNLSQEKYINITQTVYPGEDNHVTNLGFIPIQRAIDPKEKKDLISNKYIDSTNKIDQSNKFKKIGRGFESQLNKPLPEANTRIVNFSDQQTQLSNLNKSDFDLLVQEEESLDPERYNRPIQRAKQHKKTKTSSSDKKRLTKADAFSNALDMIIAVADMDPSRPLTGIFDEDFTNAKQKFALYRNSILVKGDHSNKEFDVTNYSAFEGVDLTAANTYYNGLLPATDSKTLNKTSNSYNTTNNSNLNEDIQSIDDNEWGSISTSEMGKMLKLMNEHNSKLAKTSNSVLALPPTNHNNTLSSAKNIEQTGKIQLSQENSELPPQELEKLMKKMEEYNKLVVDSNKTFVKKERLSRAILQMEDGYVGTFVPTEEFITLENPVNLKFNETFGSKIQTKIKEGLNNVAGIGTTMLANTNIKTKSFDSTTNFKVKAQQRATLNSIHSENDTSEVSAGTLDMMINRMEEYNTALERIKSRIVGQERAKQKEVIDLVQSMEDYNQKIFEEQQKLEKRQNRTVEQDQILKKMGDRVATTIQTAKNAKQWLSKLNINTKPAMLLSTISGDKSSTCGEHSQQNKLQMPDQIVVNNDMSEVRNSEGLESYKLNNINTKPDHDSAGSTKFSNNIQSSTLNIDSMPTNIITSDNKSPINENKNILSKHHELIKNISRSKTNYYTNGFKSLNNNNNKNQERNLTNTESLDTNTTSEHNYTADFKKRSATESNITSSKSDKNVKSFSGTDNYLASALANSKINNINKNISSVSLKEIDSKSNQSNYRAIKPLAKSSTNLSIESFANTQENYKQLVTTQNELYNSPEIQNFAQDSLNDNIKVKNDAVQLLDNWQSEPSNGGTADLQKLSQVDTPTNKTMQIASLTHLHQETTPALQNFHSPSKKMLSATNNNSSAIEVISKKDIKIDETIVIQTNVILKNNRASKSDFNKEKLLSKMSSNNSAQTKQDQNSKNNLSSFSNDSISAPKSKAKEGIWKSLTLRRTFSKLKSSKSRED